MAPPWASPTRARDGFTTLLADQAAGRFGVGELWVWESSRVSRKVGEWVTLIEACEAAGITVYVTSHGRRYDRANGRDWRSLLEGAVDSDFEASRVSARAMRAAAERRRRQAARPDPGRPPPDATTRRRAE